MQVFDYPLPPCPVECTKPKMLFSLFKPDFNGLVECVIKDD